MYLHTLDDASHKAQCSGATKIQANNRPGRIGHSQRPVSETYWSSVQLSPLARPIPTPVSNINILLPPQNVMIWELREAGRCSVRTKSSEILAVKVKEVCWAWATCVLSKLEPGQREQISLGWLRPTLPLLQSIKSLLKHREALRGLEEKFSWMFQHNKKKKNSTCFCETAKKWQSLTATLPDLAWSSSPACSLSYQGTTLSELQIQEKRMAFVTERSDSVKKT